MKTILVLGATGLLGKSLVKHLLKHEFKVISSIRDNHIQTYQPDNKETVVLNEDVYAGKLPHVDVVINCAFSRSNNAEHLSAALDFTEKMIRGLRKADVESVINISSQGVYKRLPVGCLSNEEAPIEPMDLYSLAKYASEKMFLLSGLKNITNIRLASLNMKQRFLYHFVQSAKNEGIIHVESPQVYASILDVEDASEALVALASMPNSKRKIVYNLSIGAQYSLLEYAEVVSSVGKALGYQAKIDVIDKGNHTTAGTDISLITLDTGWSPRITNEMMIKQLYEL